MRRWAVVAAAVVGLAGCAGRSTFLGARLPGACRKSLRDGHVAGDRCVGWVFDRLNVVARDDEYTDVALHAYVVGVAERIARANGLRSPILRIIDGVGAPATAQSGGYLYVDRDLFAALDSEAELAGVLSHELAHEASGHTADLLDAFPAATEPPLQEQRSRDDESVADELAVEYLVRAGYAPDAMRTALIAIQRAADARTTSGLLETVDEVVANMKRDGSWDVAAAAPEEPDAVSGAGTREDPAREQIVDDRHRYPREIDTSDPAHPPQAERLARISMLIAGRTTGEVGVERYREHVRGVVLGRDPRRGMLTGTTWSAARVGLAVELPATWSLDAESARLDASTPDHQAILLTIGTAWGDAVVELLADRKRVRIAGHPAVIGMARDEASSDRRSELEVAMDAPRPVAGSAVAVISVGTRALAIYVHGKDAERQLAALVAAVRVMTPAERRAARPQRLTYVTATEADAGVMSAVQPRLCGLAKESSWLEDQARLVKKGSVVKCVEK